MLFVLEVVGLFMFHLLSMPMQLLLFVKNPYFWYLLVIAVGGLLGSVELGSFSNPNPLYPGHFLAVFQVSCVGREGGVEGEREGRRCGGREGGVEGGREVWREGGGGVKGGVEGGVEEGRGGRSGGREGGVEGGREGGVEGGREVWREGGRCGERERERERESTHPHHPQALRLLRALRLVPQMRKFFSTFIGDGVRLVIVVLLVVVFLVLFAVLSMQLFGYLDPQPGCEPTDYFRDFIYVSRLVM